MQAARGTLVQLAANVSVAAAGASLAGTAAVLEAARNSRIVLTVEEHNILGGLGSAVAEIMAENPGKARLKRHGIMDEYALISPPMRLYQHYKLDGAGVREVAQSLI